MALLSIQLNYVAVLDIFFLLSVQVALKKKNSDKHECKLDLAPKLSTTLK